MNNLFLTGNISIGKTTILKKAIDQIDLSIGGYTTRRVTHGLFRSFVVQSIDHPMREFTIATVDSRDLSKEVFPEAFRTELPSLLEYSYKNSDLIVLDELGFLENDILAFTSKVYELLGSDKVVLGVLKDYDCEFLNSIRLREDVEIIRITMENRDSILSQVLERLRFFNVPLK